MNQITKVESQGTEVAVHEGASAMMAIIARAASDPSIDVSKMTALLDMQERIMAKNAEIEFNEALARLSRVMPRINKDGQVEYAEDKTKPNGPKVKAFKFATYENIDRVIRPLLQEEGMSLSFTTAPRSGDGGGAIVTGTLSHKSGHSRSASISVALDTSGGKNNIQAMGSSFSYGKRYTTTMLLNIVTEEEDDDGKLGGMTSIDDEQITQIYDLLAETNSDLEKFKKFMGVAEVEHIQKNDFARAINGLSLKKQQKGGVGMKIYNMPQGSSEWLAARLGVPTASCFEKIVTPTGKLSAQSRKYMHWLLAEKILNRSLEAIDNLEWVERGKELEPKAVTMYEFEYDVETLAVGFITTDDGSIGCSPDRLAGDEGLVEIKCPAPQTHIGYMLDGFGDDYKPQVQGQLMVTGRTWCDRYSYSPEMPPVRVRTYRDEPYIKLLADSLAEFNERKEAALDVLRAQGFFLKRSKTAAPQDVAYDDVEVEHVKEIFT